MKPVTCIRIEDMGDKLDDFPFFAVLEPLPECLSDRQVFDVFAALIPVTILDVSEILPLESARARSSIGNVGDIGRNETRRFL